MMQVIINSDGQIEINEQKIEDWKDQVHDALQRFNDWITRVEVHLSDENSRAKTGDDAIRCLMEARPANHQPVSIEVRSASPGQAMHEAIDTLENRLDHMLEKMRTEQRKR